MPSGSMRSTRVSDARAFVAWLGAPKAVDSRRKIGTTGYCMGGPIVMRTAGSLPEIEVYKRANHGWTPPDSQNHNAKAAERGWERKLALFKKALA